MAFASYYEKKSGSFGPMNRIKQMSKHYGMESAKPDLQSEFKKSGFSRLHRTLHIEKHFHASLSGDGSIG